eukprot:CAMPEP_0183738980 /NCGR_PEP_ID=MMETSP0737-20130205/55924_1 /TAXON_ID=385413 /ORGANISM="Thalassiosira miniscula, Strain CCMP1093" /LENGTH=313 /DNA_ID=CAMNT_0025973641 /DNA_START=49 /DNA_END=987 /DNA_ORIENTATION=-
MNKENQFNFDGRVGRVPAKLRGSKPICRRNRRHHNQHAANYVAQVKAKFGANSFQYRIFSKTLRACMAKTIPPREVILRIQNLFKENEELMMGLNAFLPMEYKIVEQLPKANDNSKDGGGCILDSSEKKPCQTKNTVQPSSANKIEPSLYCKEDQSIGSELFTIRQLQQELVDLKIKKEQLSQHVDLSAEKHQSIEDIEWDIIVVQQTIKNIRLGMELKNDSVVQSSLDMRSQQQLGKGVAMCSSLVGNEEVSGKITPTTTKLTETREEFDAFNEFIDEDTGGDPKARRCTLDAMKYLLDQCNDQKKQEENRW